MNKILVATAQREESEDEFKKKPLYQSLFTDAATLQEVTDTHAFYTDDFFDVVVRLGNTESICKHYNKCIDLALQASDTYSCVLFIHDDVSMEDRHILEKLRIAFKDFDVVGLAGAKTAKIKEPVLWHLMSDKSHHSGAVAHPLNCCQYSMTNFGPTPERCLILDGLFIAVKIAALQNENIRFDEDIPTVAHFYDIDFCLNANKNKLKLTTWPIWVIHSSPGLSQRSEEFEIGQKYIINKWRDR